MATPVGPLRRQAVLSVLATLFAAACTVAHAADSAVVIVSHEVRDFAEWKKNFDAGKDRRKQTGMTERYVMRDAQKPNAVIVVLETRDVDTAKKFVSDSAFKERIKKASATGTADIKIGTTSTSGK